MNAHKSLQSPINSNFLKLYYFLSRHRGINVKRPYNMLGIPWLKLHKFQEIPKIFFYCIVRMHARVLLYVIHSAVKVNTGSPPTAMPSFCEKIRNNQLYTEYSLLHIPGALKSGPIIFFSLPNLQLVSHKKVSVIACFVRCKPN